MNRTLVVAGLVVLMMLLAGAAFVYWRANSLPQQAVRESDLDATSTWATTSSSAPVVAPANSLLYSNTQFHFSLYYPNDLKLKTYNEAGGAFTASFQDPSTNEGFEVYLTPYSGTQITEARFKLDEPSGTFLQPTNVVIDGTQATMFFGNNGVMGDTREVWFIQGGYLYEVATYKPLDAWLSQIMATWRFI